MKYNIVHSLIFSLLIQVLTPFVLASGVIAQARENILLVCTSNGYEWIEKPGTTDSQNEKEDIPSSRCPLCLAELELSPNLLVVSRPIQGLVRQELKYSHYLRKNKSKNTLACQNFHFQKEVLGRAPPFLLPPSFLEV